MAERRKFIISQSDKCQKRIYVPRACEFCNIKHIQCDRGRPCQNCLKRDRASLCKDVSPIRKKKSKTTKFSPNMAITTFNDNNNNNLIRSIPCDFLATNNFHALNYNNNMNNGRDNFCSPNNFSPNLIQPNDYNVSNIIENPNVFLNSNMTKNNNNNNNMTMNNNYNMPINSYNNSNRAMMNNTDLAMINNSSLATRNNSYIWSNRPTINQRRRSSDDNTMSDITTYTTPKGGRSPNPIKNINFTNNDSDQRSSSVINDNSNRNKNNLQCLDDINVMNILGSWDMNGSQKSDFNQFDILPIKHNHLKLQSASPMFTGVNGVLSSFTPAKYQFDQNDNLNEITDQVFNHSKNLENVYLNNQRNTDIPYVDTPPPIDFENVENNQITPLELRKQIKNVQDLFTKSYLIKSHNYKKAFQTLQEIYSHKKMMMMIKYSLNDNPINSLDSFKNSNQSKLPLIQSIQFFITQFICFAPTMNSKKLMQQEMMFAKTLLEQENELSNVDSVIIAIWRRSGEISFVNEKFLNFFECTYEEVLGRTRFIFEFWNDETTNRYMAKYSETMDFTRDDPIPCNSTGNNERSNFSAPLEYYDLIKKDGTISRSLASITIEKDTSVIPILIIGQLLPIKN